MAKQDTNYRYSGPLSGVTLDDGREVMLHPEATVPLPADNAYVKTLVAQGLLTEVAAKEPPVEEPPKPQAKTAQATAMKEDTNAG